MSKPRILVTCAQMMRELPAHSARIEKLGYELVVPDLGGRQQFTASEMVGFGPGIVGVIAGDDELDATFFEGSSDLRVLVRWGIGTDSVDFAAAQAHGVVVRNTPGVFNDEVADSALAYVLALARGHVAIDRAVRQGDWPKYEGLTLAGTRIGIIGLGGIGRGIARRAAGFGMEVVGFDPYPFTDCTVDIEFVSLATLAHTSRFIVLACPLTAETRHLIDAGFLEDVALGTFVVNVARGSVVNERDLAEALRTGRLAGAALDVFEIEPLPESSPLRDLPNVILGSHNGSNTRQGVARASSRAVDILLEELTQ